MCWALLWVMETKQETPNWGPWNHGACTIVGADKQTSKPKRGESYTCPVEAFRAEGEQVQRPQEQRDVAHQGAAGMAVQQKGGGKAEGVGKDAQSQGTASPVRATGSPWGLVRVEERGPVCLPCKGL